MSCRFFVALFLIATATLPIRAQQAPAAAHELTYETVSVRANPQANGMSISPQGNRYTARGVTLWDLLNDAYPIRANTEVPGLPGWARTELFDLDATMSAASYEAFQKLSDNEQRAQRQTMLQAVLATQFHLKLHTKTKTLPQYALVIAKGGPKLTPATANAQSGGTTWGSGQIKIPAGPLSKLAYCLSDATGVEIIDKTGLTETYAITLNWTAGKDDSAISTALGTALKEQLGLKLEAGKRSIELYFVDHVERPA